MIEIVHQKKMITYVRDNQIDVQKLRTAIKESRFTTPPVYRTWLYCMRSQMRGHIHMTTWNKYHQHNLDVKIYEFGNYAGGPPPTNTPYYWVRDAASGRYDFTSLEDQAKFIVYLRQYITGKVRSARDMQKRNPQFSSDYNNMWINLETDFELKGD
jgi:hypothetical protein